MSYTHLTLKERYVIYHLQLCRLSIRKIARCLQRAHTTISREIQRNRSTLNNSVQAATANYLPNFQYSILLYAQTHARYLLLALRRVKSRGKRSISR